MKKLLFACLASLIIFIFNPSSVLAAPSAEELRPYVTKTAKRSYIGIEVDHLRVQLEKEIISYIQTHNWKNFCFIAGKAACRYYHTDNMFAFEVLAMSMPFASDSTQQSIKTYLQSSDIFSTTDGSQLRSWYDVGPKTASVISYKDRYEFSNKQKLYSLWIYAYYTGDWEYIENNWSTIESLGNSLSTNSGDNLETASLIGYARMADELNKANKDTLINNAAAALRNRLIYEENNAPSTWYHEKQGFLTTYWNGQSHINRWREMRNELGRALWDYETSLVNQQKDFANVVLSTQPYLFGLASGRTEQASTIPITRRDIFLAQAHLFNNSGPFVEGLVDSAESKADPFHIERLAIALEKLGQIDSWEDHKDGPFWPDFNNLPSPSPSSSPDPTADILTILANWGNIGGDGDFYNDGKVNGMDFGHVIKSWE